MLLCTDGVVENRGRGGDFFSPDRLIDLACRLVLADESPPEAARKINDAVVDFHDGPPSDDFTVVVLDWSP